MAEKVLKVGMDREDGFLYYIDKDGDIARVQMARGGKKGGKPKKVEKCGIKKEKGYLYFLDKKGDISRAKMVNAKQTNLKHPAVLRGVSQTKALAHHIHFFRARLCQTRRGATRIVRHHALLQRFVPLYDFSKRLAKGNAFCKYVANLARSCGPQFSESFKQANRGRYLFISRSKF